MTPEEVAKVRELLTHEDPDHQRQGLELAKSFGDYSAVFEGCMRLTVRDDIIRVEMSEGGLVAQDDTAILALLQVRNACRARGAFNNFEEHSPGDTLTVGVIADDNSFYEVLGDNIYGDKSYEDKFGNERYNWGEMDPPDVAENLSNQGWPMKGCKIDFSAIREHQMGPFKQGDPPDPIRLFLDSDFGTPFIIFSGKGYEIDYDQIDLLLRKGVESSITIWELEPEYD